MVLTDGTVLKSKTVISDCGYIKTFTRLLPERFSYRVKDFESGCQHFIVFLGFKAGQETMGFPKFNIYTAQNVNHFNYKDFCAQEIIDDNVPLPAMFINFPTVHHAQNGRSIALIAIEARYDWFKVWKNKEDGEYARNCQALMNRCLEKFFSCFPNPKSTWILPDTGRRWTWSNG